MIECNPVDKMLQQLLIANHLIDPLLLNANHLIYCCNCLQTIRSNANQLRVIAQLYRWWDGEWWVPPISTSCTHQHHPTSNKRRTDLAKRRTDLAKVKNRNYYYRRRFIWPIWRFFVFSPLPFFSFFSFPARLFFIYFFSRACFCYFIWLNIIILSSVVFYLTF